MAELNTASYRWFEDALGGVRSRLYWTRLLTGLLVTVGAILSTTVVLFLLDNVLHFSPAMRSILTPVWVLAMLGAIVLFFVRLVLRHPSQEHAALAVQREYPEVGERPINAAQICRNGSASSFVAAMVDETVRFMKDLDLSKVANRRVLARTGVFAGCALLAFLIYGGGFSPYFSNAARRFLQPSMEIGRVGAPQITVTPGDVAVSAGEAVRVRSVIHGKCDSPADLLWRSEGDDWQSCPMSAAEAGFTHEFADVRAPFVYRVRAGKSMSEKFSVKILPALGISQIKLHYEYPKYTRLSPKDIEDSDGRIEGLVGTQVALELKASRPVKSAELVLQSLDRQPLRVVDDAELAGKLTIKESGQYSIQMQAEAGDAGTASITYPIVATPDTPPHLELAAAVSQATAAPSDTLPLKIKATDDFGVAAVRLKMRVGEEEGAWTQVREWKLEAPQETLGLDFAMELAGYSLKPGNIITIVAEGQDSNDISGPGIGTSEELIIEIKEPELLAEDKDDEYAAGLEALAKLVQRQKDNLEQTTEVRTRMRPDGELAGTDKARLGVAREEQAKLRDVARSVSKQLEASHPAAPLTLDPLAAKEMVAAVRGLETAETGAVDQRGTVLEQSIELEKTILSQLEDLLHRLTQEQHAVRVQDVLRELKEIHEAQTNIKESTGAEHTSLAKLGQQEGELRPRMKAVESMLKTLVGNLRPFNADLARAANRIADETRDRRIPADIVQAQSDLQESRREDALKMEDEVLTKVAATIEAIMRALVENADKEKEKLAKGLEEIEKKAEKLAALEKKVKEAVEALNKLDEDELGEPEKKKFEKLAEFQERAAQVSETAKEDLEKLPQAPFVGDMVKEFDSITKKLDLTKEMLQKQEPNEKCVKCTEELMESLMKVAEKSKDGQAFLDKSPDTTKFNLEDIPEGMMPEIPMVELPDKLTDMVGDLIEKQEDQNEDTNDKSSNWAKADSKAGVPKEGPMSSFGGKGKTGNHRPDPTEIRGRGGAGRTGQTSGELIEGATKNLDGDPTPERRTPDPVQEGGESIEDNDPKHATATGGGKKGGAGGEGMPGRANDVFEEDLDELAERQDSLRTDAEQLEGALSALHLPKWTLPDAVRMMREAQDHLRSHNITEAQEKQKLAVQALKIAYQSMKGKPYVHTEQISALPPDLKREVIQARSEKFPAPFKDLLQRYYQEISDQAVK